LVYNENILTEKNKSAVRQSLFIWTVLAALAGARLDMFFYDWEYFRNHLSEIVLPSLAFGTRI
jgi:prolipoprotein diacylglyceryltransferase